MCTANQVSIINKMLLGSMHSMREFWGGKLVPI